MRSGRPLLVLGALSLLLTSCDGGDRRAAAEWTIVKNAAGGTLTLPWRSEHPDKIARLQGIWVVQSFGWTGYRAAWKFNGARVTVYDAEKKTEITDVLRFESPCEVGLDGYGGALVIDGDAVYLGLGDGGWKDGDTIVACMGSGTVYATPGGCTTYAAHFGGQEYETIETTCSQPEGRFVTVEKSNYGESSLRFWNDRILLSGQLAENKIVKYSDWDAAKAAADRLFDEWRRKYGH